MRVFRVSIALFGVVLDIERYRWRAKSEPKWLAWEIEVVVGKTVLAAPSGESHCTVTKGKLEVKREIIVHRGILFGPTAKDVLAIRLPAENVHEGIDYITLNHGTEPVR